MSAKTARRAPNLKYPWAQWLAFAPGQVTATLRLAQGTHFACAPHGMAQQVRNAVFWANSDGRGRRVSIRVSGTELLVHISLPQERGT